jgi:hypothetical protein
MKPIDHLAKRCGWWWRTCPDFRLTPKGQTRDNDTPESHFWKAGIEHAAYAYELVRRLDRSIKTPAWPSLHPSIQMAVNGVVGRDQHYQIIRIKDHRPHEALDDPSYTQPAEFNLLASKSALERAFTAFIQRERRRKGMVTVKPELPPRNSPSWRWLEVWDASEVGRIPLGSSESAMLCRARKRATQLQPAIMGYVKAAAAKKVLSFGIQ